MIVATYSIEVDHVTSKGCPCKDKDFDAFIAAIEPHTEALLEGIKQHMEQAAKEHLCSQETIITVGD